MIYKNIELHNADGLLPMKVNTVMPLRSPIKVIEKLNTNAQMRMSQPDNIEIRFVSDGTCKIKLSSTGECKASLFYGNFDSRERFVVKPEGTGIIIPEIEKRGHFNRLGEEYLKNLSFSPNVVRLILGGTQRDQILFKEVEGDDIRPPKQEELPKLRYLAYGTSITHGFTSEGPHLSYVGQAAYHLGADLINLGVGGAAHCEKELADYIANREDWDIASLALSVNMLMFPIEEFKERVTYMVHQVAGKNPSKPVACITLYPFHRDFLDPDYVSEPGAKAEDYRQALRDAVASYEGTNAHLIEGPDILKNISGLSTDLIHPSDNGMIEMGRNLAAKLKEFI